METVYELPLGLPSRDSRTIFGGRADVWVAAAPEEVYALVSNLVRMGEFSPDCIKATLEQEPGSER